MAYDGSIKIDTSIDSGKLMGQLGRFSAGLSKAVAGMAVAGTVALGGFTASAVKDFASLETSMSEVFTLLPGISKEAMGDMTDDVLSFAKEFKTLPEEIVPALYQSLSAGVPQDTVFDFMETATKLAKGGVTELETAVDGLSSVVNAYGEEVISAQVASDIMFTTVKLGKTTVDELAGALFNVIPTAASAGVEFDQIAAGLALMTSQGVPTSVATTQLRQMLVELTKAGSATSDTFGELSGTTFKDFIESGNTVADALELMQEYADDNNLSISDLFGSVEAGNAALQLSGDNLDKYRVNIDAMATSAGATEEAYRTMNDTMQSGIDQLEASISVLKIEFAENFAPIAVESIQSILDIVNELEPAFKMVSDGLSGMLIDPMSEQGVMDAIFGIDRKQQLVDGATEIMTVLGDAMIGALPVLLDVTLGILEAMSASLVNNAPILSDFLFTLVPKIAETLQIVLPDLAEAAIVIANALALGILNGLPAIIEAVYQIIPTIVLQLSNQYPLLMQKAQEMIPMMVKTWVEMYPELSKSMILLIQTLSVAMTQNMPILIETVEKMMPVIVQILAASAPLWSAAAKALVMALIEGFKLTLTSLFDVGFDMGENAKKGLKQVDLFGAAKDIGENIIAGLEEGIKNAAGKVKDAVLKVGYTAIDTVKDVLDIQSPSKVMESLGEFTVEGFLNGMTGMLPELTDTVKAMFTDTLVGIEGDLKLSVSSMEKLLNSVSPTYVESSSNIKPKLTDEELARAAEIDARETAQDAKHKLYMEIDKRESEFDAQIKAAKELVLNAGNSLGLNSVGGVPIVISNNINSVLQIDGEAMAQSNMKYIDNVVQGAFGGVI